MLLQDTSLCDHVKCVTPSKKIHIIKHTNSQANASTATSAQLEFHLELEGLKASQKLGKVATSDLSASTTKSVKNGESERDTDPVYHHMLEVVISKKRATSQAKYRKSTPITPPARAKKK